MRRFGRKPELQLLMKTAAEWKNLSAYQWQNMSSSGLRYEEVAMLIHALSASGPTGAPPPKQALGFRSLLECRLRTLEKGYAHLER